MKTRESKLILVIIILLSLLIGMSINSIINSKITLINGKQIIKEMTEGEYESKLTELNTSHEDYALLVEANKQKLATAITNEKVPTSKDASIDEMVTNIEKILEAGTSDATATEEDIAEGKTAWVQGKEIVGTGKILNDSISTINSVTLISGEGYESGNFRTLSYTSDGTYNYYICDSGQAGSVSTDGNIIFQSESYGIGGAHTHKLSIVKLENGQYVTLTGWTVYLYGIE